MTTSNTQQPKILNVRIFQQYLTAIIKGAKKTEYRDMSDYWMRRLVDVDKYGKATENEDDLRHAIQTDNDPPFKPWRQIRFHSGANSATYEIETIRVYPHHSYFAIKLGRRLK